MPHKNLGRISAKNAETSSPNPSIANWKSHPYLSGVFEWKNFVVRYLREADVWEINRKGDTLNLQYETLSEAKAAAEKYYNLTGAIECFCDDCCGKNIRS